MLSSPILKKNPDLFVFLPVLYTVWSDAVLTPSEITTLQGLIKSQEWLTNDERNLLLEQINPSTPPSPDEFITWREEIKKVTNGTTGNSLVRLKMKNHH
jgi:acyl-CoA oxidase